MDNHFISYKIEDRSYLALLKREIKVAVQAKAFTEKQKGEIDIIVSEITSNVIKHAGIGEILYRISASDTSPTFEILAIDGGPGIDDVPKMMKDGNSTTMTLGHGLGTLERMSTVFNIFSLPKWGTVLYSRVSNPVESGIRKGKLELEANALLVCKPREVVCGDGYRIKRTSTEVRIFFGDGLGHGESAKEAVDRAGDFFMTCQEDEPVDILRRMHEAVRRTRGLVGSVGIFDIKSQQWKLCGVGNISARVYTGIMYKNYISYNGTIGLNIPNSMRSSVIEAEKNQSLIMCSDGLRTRWDLTRYPAILRYDSMVLAAALYKDFSRGTDDSSILIAKLN